MAKRKIYHGARDSDVRFSCFDSKEADISKRLVIRELAYLLSHLRSVTQHLERTWSRAFLKRTRFLEPDFQGDILAVISRSTSHYANSLLTRLCYLVGMISTALRTGSPLPQVTPCPLLDRFVATLPGFNITRKDEEDFGLPRTITVETLEDEQYLYVIKSYHFALRI